MADLVHRVDVDTKRIVLTAHLPRMFGIRMWLTIKLLLLAGMVSPTTIRVVQGDGSSDAGD